MIAQINGAARAFEVAQPLQPAEPLPLLRETPDAPPYPVEALGPLRPAVEAIFDVTQAPLAIAAQSVLGVAALAAQGLADVEGLDGRKPTSLFLVSVAESGERKSSCDRLGMRAVREFEAELAETFKEEVAAHRDALDSWQERRKAILRTAKDDPDTARAELRDLGPEPEAPLFPSVIASEPTLEGITKHMDRLRASLGLFSDEGGAFLGGHAMSKENRLRTLAGLSRFWDASPVDRWRAGDGVAVYRGRRVSAHLMVQPVVATELLGDPLATGQGFLARCLVSWPPSAIGERLRLGHSEQSDAALGVFTARVGALLRRPLPLRSGSRNELSPPLVKLSAEARHVLQEFYLGCEAAQAPDGPLADVRPAASKAPEQAARIAGVLSLFADPAAEEVAGETMADAVALAQHYVNEAARLADAAAVAPETAEAERLRRWLVERWPEPFISLPDATQRSPLRDSERARSALGKLERHGWLLPQPDGAVVLGKRRRAAWRIVKEATA